MEHIRDLLPMALLGLEAFDDSYNDWPLRFRDTSHQTASPIEQVFEHCFYKYVEPHITLVSQAILPTPRSTYRLDFVAKGPFGTIGFECDGAQYHHGSYDLRRDFEILATGRIDQIVRMNGYGLSFRREDVFYLLARLVPALFTARTRVVLDRQASQVAKESAPFAGNFVYSVPYKSASAFRDDDSDLTPAGELVVLRYDLATVQLLINAILDGDPHALRHCGAASDAGFKRLVDAISFAIRRRRAE